MASHPPPEDSYIEGLTGTTFPPLAGYLAQGYHHPWHCWRPAFTVEETQKSLLCTVPM